MSRFDYIKYNSESATIQDIFKKDCIQIEEHINKFIPAGRSCSLALTHLEEVYMWIGKAIRDIQIEKNENTEPNESRDPGK